MLKTYTHNSLFSLSHTHHTHTFTDRKTTRPCPTLLTSPELSPIQLEPSVTLVPDHVLIVSPSEAAAAILRRTRITTVKDYRMGGQKFLNFSISQPTPVNIMWTLPKGLFAESHSILSRAIMCSYLTHLTFVWCVVIALLTVARRLGS